MLELTVRLIASLAVVIGLLLLLARFGGRRFRGRSGELVRVVHRQPLSRTSSVSVVAVGSRVLVLGTTEQQITILTELDAEELDLDEPDDLDAPHDLDAELLELPAAPVPHAMPAAARQVPQPGPTSGLTSQSLLEAITQSPAQPSMQSPGARRLPAAHRARLTHLDEVPEVVAEPVTRPIVVAHPVLAPSVRPAESPVTAPTMNAVLAALAAREADVSRARAAAEQLLDEETDLAPVTRPSPRPVTRGVGGAGPLAGSVLSVATWRQAFAAATGKAS